MDRHTAHQSKDHHECGKQVAEMPSIFRSASSVIESLGEVAEAIVTVMNMIEEDANDESVHWSPTLQLHIVVNGMDLHSPLLQDHLLAIFSVAWWSRD